MEETLTRHRKELKSLEGEKRALLKKAKTSTKGKKKAKEVVLAALEEEYSTKLTELRQRHLQEVKELEQQQQQQQQQQREPSEPEESQPEGQSSVVDVDKDTVANNNNNKDDDDAAAATATATAVPAKVAKRQAKLRRKREQARQRQRELDEQRRFDLERGPSARRDELQLLEAQLEPLGLVVRPVASDGHCLYRAVAEQCANGTSYQDIRNLCASSLRQHEEDFAPFLEYPDTNNDGSTDAAANNNHNDAHDDACHDDNNNNNNFERYVQMVQDSAEWGGHVELRALSLALRRSILVYFAESSSSSQGQSSPLVIHDEFQNDNVIRLSYHLHYYSLGEHYNCVVVKESDKDEHEEEEAP